MTQQVINIGSAPNDGLGDPLRTAFTKCNTNFTQLFNTYKTSVPSTAYGAAGDVAGMYAGDASAFYYCFATYTTGGSEIWRKVTGSSF